MSFQTQPIHEILTKPIHEVLKQPGPRWDLTISVKEVDEGDNKRRLWVTGIRSDASIYRNQAIMALEFALKMLRNEKWYAESDALFASAPS